MQTNQGVMLAIEEALLNDENIEQAARLITRAYNTNYPLILNSLVTSSQFESSLKPWLRKYQRVQRQVNKELGTQTDFLHVLKVNGKVMATLIFVELHSYLDSRVKENDPYGIDDIYDFIEHSKIPKGKAFITTRMAVDPSLMKSGLMTKFLLSKIKYMMSQGYEDSYHYVWTQAGGRMTESIGSEVIHEKDFILGKMTIKQTVYKSNILKTIEYSKQHSSNARNQNSKAKL